MHAVPRADATRVTRACTSHMQLRRRAARKGKAANLGSVRGFLGDRRRRVWGISRRSKRLGSKWRALLGPTEPARGRG
jgi:hypothetical protein